MLTSPEAIISVPSASSRLARPSSCEGFGGRKRDARAEGLVQACRPGQTLLRQGERASGVLVVEQGLVGLCIRHLDGRRQILFLAGPGDILCTPGGGVMADAEALSPGKVRFHPAGSPGQQPDVEADWRMRIARQHERTLAHVFALGQREARQRLGWLLTTLADGRRVLDLPLSRQDIADYLGLTIETVSREFTRLKRLGAITYARHGSITILEPATLAETAM